jgi:hypothetical protein
MRLPERFRAKFTCANSGCWEWHSTLNGNGYGRYWSGGAQGAWLMAHRFAYEALVGPIPDGLDIDHLCRNRICVNPAHMEPVTRRENTRRGENHVARYMESDHCAHGHLLAGDNVMRRSDGSRRCRECKRAWDRANRKSRAKNASTSGTRRPAAPSAESNQPAAIETTGRSVRAAASAQKAG